MLIVILLLNQSFSLARPQASSEIHLERPKTTVGKFLYNRGAS